MRRDAKMPSRADRHGCRIVNRRDALRVGAATVLWPWGTRSAMADGESAPAHVPTMNATSKRIGPLGLELRRAHPILQGGALAPVLLIPGAYHGAWAFEDNLMPYLARQGFDVYAMSLRGHGTSGGVDRVEDAGFEDYVTDVLTVMAELPEAPILVGHSLGGLLARKVAERKALRAVVLMASPTPRSMREGAMRLIRQFPLPMVKFALTGNPDHVYRDVNVVRGLLFGGSRHPEVDATIQRMLAERESRRIIADVQTLEFAPNRVPLLAIGGDADIGVPVSALQEAADFYGGSVKVLPGAAHEFFLMHGWESAAGCIVDWLQRGVGTPIRGARVHSEIRQQPTGP